MSDFHIDSNIVKLGVATITIKGPLDTETSDELTKTFEALFAKKAYKIAIDLSQVEYISSVGIGTLISVFDTLQENDGGMIFVRPTDDVKAALVGPAVAAVC